MSNADEKLTMHMKDLIETQRIARIGTWRIDLITNHVSWSDEMMIIFGLDPLVPPPLLQEQQKFFTKESWNRLQSSISDTRNKGTFYEEDLPAVNAKGERLNLHIWGEAERDAQGSICAVWGAIQDVTRQTATKQALKDSEERYRCLFEHAGIAIGYYTPEGVIISYNRKALEYLSGPLENYVGHSIHEVFAPREAGILADLIKNARSSHAAVNQEHQITLPSGKRWVSAASTKVTNADGEVIGIQISSFDITEKKITENALLETQTILRMAFENSQAGILIVDAPDGKLRYANKAGMRMINGTDDFPKDIDIHSYTSICPMYHFDGAAYTTEEMPIVRAMLHGDTVSEEFVIRRGDTESYGLANAAPIFDADHQITASIVIFFDITDRKRSEDTIRKQNQLFESLLKLLPVGVFMVDAKDGKPLIANETAKNLLGRGILPDVSEENLSEVYHSFRIGTDEQYPTTEMPIVLGMKGISAHIEDMVVERPDGSKIQLEVFGSPVIDKDGNPWASLVTFINITERKKAENDLRFLSYHDKLTGLYNRSFFENEMQRLDNTQNLPVSLLVCDINGLKLMNDSFGHENGDKLLMKAAEVLSASSREGDIVARAGGDEFIIIMPKTDAAGAARVMKKIKQLAAKEEVENVELSISIGHDTKTREKEKMIEILANAENNMYRNKLYERSSTRSKTIEIIMNTLFEKSNRESNHSERVSRICQAIASRMLFDKDEINKVRIAGLVHDIGKIGIDEKILNKPGKLSNEEREEINKHPEIGWRILSSSAEFSELATFVMYHQEKWDGSGYPSGLQGNAIPLVSRIIAVADSYDAMTRDRTYRAGLTKEEAVEELKRCAGTQFDPEIVKIFIEQVLIDEE